MKSFGVVIVCMFALATPLSAGASESNRFISREDMVSIVSEADFASGSSLEVGLLFRLTKDWHIYWKDPGDVGLPPSLTLTRPGQTAGDFTWPAPEWLIANSFGNYVVSGTVLLPFKVDIAHSGGEREIDLQANAHWLVCSAVICVPQEAMFTLHLSAGRARLSFDAPLFTAARAAQPRPSNFDTSVTSAGILLVTGKDYGKGRVRGAHFFPNQGDAIINAAPQVLTLNPNGFSLDLRLHKWSGMTPLVGTLEITNAEGTTRSFTVEARVAHDMTRACVPMALDPAPVNGPVRSSVNPAPMCPPPAERS